MGLPFGQTLYLWRRARGLTQAELARRTRLSRPNLSAIEQGKREVTLGTLRALAVGLGIRPGMLADGMAPSALEQNGVRLSREALERIADAVAFNRPVTGPTERITVEALRSLLGHRTRAARGQWGRPRTTRRKALAAWIQLRSLYGRSAIHAFADRVLERQRAHDRTSD